MLVSLFKFGLELPDFLLDFSVLGALFERLEVPGFFGFPGTGVQRVVVLFVIQAQTASRLHPVFVYLLKLAAFLLAFLLIRVQCHFGLFLLLFIMMVDKINQLLL